MALGFEGFGYLRNIIKLAPEVKQPCHIDGHPLEPSSSHSMEVARSEGSLTYQVSNKDVGTFKQIELDALGKPKGHTGISHGNGSMQGKTFEKGLSSMMEGGSHVPSGTSSRAERIFGNAESTRSSESTCTTSEASRGHLSDCLQSQSNDPPDSARLLSSFRTVSSSIQQQVEALEVQLAVKEAEVRRLAEVFSGTEVALAEREKEAQHLSALAQNLEEQIEAKDEVLELSQELIGSLEERLLALEVQRDSLEARAAESAQSVGELAKETERLLADVDDLEHDRAVAGSKIEELTDQIKSLEKRLVNEEDETASLKARLRDAKKSASERVEGLTQKAARMQKRLSEATEALRLSAQTVDNLKQQVCVKEAALAESKAECHVQSESLQDLKAQVNDLRKDVLRKEGNLEAVEAHVADLERQLDGRERECRQARANVSGLLVQLEAKHTGARAEVEGMRRELDVERALRGRVERQLSAKKLELEAAHLLIDALKKDLAGDHNGCEKRGQTASPSASSAESISGQEQPCILGDAENLCKQGSDSSWLCEDTDAESVASVPEAMEGSQLACQGDASPPPSRTTEPTAQWDAAADASPVLSAPSGRSSLLQVKRFMCRVFSRRCSREESESGTALQGLKVLLLHR